MGGKRVNGRSGSGDTMHPRIFSAESTKSSLNESTSRMAPFVQRENHDASNLQRSHDHSSTDVQYKSDFDIISLLGNQEEDADSVEVKAKSYSSEGFEKSDVPSFWHFVEPTASNPADVFHRPLHSLHKELRFTPDNFNSTFSNNVTKKPVAEGMHINKNSKRTMKRRKTKKAQSAKTTGFKTLDKSSGRLRKDGRELLRVLTPPGTGSTSLNDSEDELIRRYFSGLSSAGSSISWAEDAMESEFTTQLMKLWEDIESVCAGARRPEKMSDAVFNECMQWRKAFPNPDLHRFSNFRNDGNVSSVGSLVLDYEQGDGEAGFSSIIHSPSPRSFTAGQKQHEENMKQLETNFRAMNCSTPRPNIEKSTQYVSAWLSECQNSSVPERNRSSLDYKYDRSLPTSPRAINSPSQENNESKTELDTDVYPQRLAPERSSYSHYSRNHAKLVNDPDPGNFFTSLAISNNEIYSHLENKSSASFGIGAAGGGDINHLPYITPRLNNPYHDSINEADEEGSSTPTEMVSFRPNVRVQRPISSRVRDHAIAPIATGSYVYSSYPGRYHGTNVSKQVSSTNESNVNGSENYRFRRRPRLFDSFNDSATASASAKVDTGNGFNRIKSGLIRQGQSLTSHLGRGKQQQPWSRHSGEDLTAEANYVSSLYENYPNSFGNGSMDGLPDLTSTNVVGPKQQCSSPSSANDSLRYFEHARGPNGARSLTECEDISYNPTVSWLVNR